MKALIFGQNSYRGLWSDSLPILEGQVTGQANRHSPSNLFGGVHGWLLEGTTSQFSFVSTNSISQGTQVPILWPHILELLESGFCHQSLKWSNHAKENAGVTCIIVGAKNINPYLADTNTLYINNRRKTLSHLPQVCFGSMANDGGNLFLSRAEYKELIALYSEAERLIRKTVGSKEFINGIERFCFWIEDKDKSLAFSIPTIASKVELVRKHREESDRVATQVLSKSPHTFGEVRHIEGCSIIIPSVLLKEEITFLLVFWIVIQ